MTIIGRRAARYTPGAGLALALLSAATFGTSGPGKLKNALGVALDSKGNVVEFDRSGKVLKTWGSGFVYPHGIRIDRNGFLWLTDARGENGKGQQIFKYTRDGKLLMTIGALAAKLKLFRLPRGARRRGTR